MEQTPNTLQHIPTYEEIMTMIYEDRRILRESSADFDRRMKEEELTRQKILKDIERESKKTDKKISMLSENFISQSGHIVEGLMEPGALKIF